MARAVAVEGPLCSIHPRKRTAARVLHPDGKRTGTIWASSGGQVSFLPDGQSLPDAWESVGGFKCLELHPLYALTDDQRRDLRRGHLPEAS